MSGINLTLNTRLQAFKTFAADSKETSPEGKTVAMSKTVVSGDSREFSVAKSNVRSRSGAFDQLHFWGRTDDMKKANNNTRHDFFDAVVEQFGGNPKYIPESVKEAMLLGDSGLDKNDLTALGTAFNTGKPLLARRIDAVITEIEKLQAKEYGAATFESFYDEITTVAPDADIKKSCEESLIKGLMDFVKKLVPDIKYYDQSAIGLRVEYRVQEMLRLLGGNPKEFKLHAGMEKILKNLRDDVVGAVTSKNTKAIVKVGFNSLIDSFKVERKLDEKIAEVFNKRHVETKVLTDGKIKKTEHLSVNEGDQKLADLKAELDQLEKEDPPSEEKIKKAKDAIKKQEDYLKGTNRTQAMDAAIKELLNDKEFCALAAKKRFGLVTRDDFDASNKDAFSQNAANTNGKGAFIKEIGSTSQVIEKFHRKNPEMKMCVHVYGDRTFPFCGLLDQHWRTQEEATVRDSNIKTWASLIGQGLIKPSQKKKDRFEFATDKMNSIRGFTVKTSIQFANQTKMARPINVTFLFSSMPCHTDHVNNLDADGDYDFLMDCKNKEEDWKVEEADLPQARKFIDTFHGLWQRKWGKDLREQKGYDSRDFQIALKFLKFSGPNDRFNVFGENSEEEVIRLLDFVKNNYTQKDIAEKQVKVREAERNLNIPRQKLERMEASFEAATAKLPACAKVDQALKEARAAYKNAKDQAKTLNVKFEDSPDFAKVSAALDEAESQYRKVLGELEKLGFKSMNLEEEIQKQKDEVTSCEQRLKSAEDGLKTVTDQVNSAEGKAFDEILQRSNDNYEQIVRKHVHEWITMARATGADVFVGGPIGTGAFGNEPELVASILAEEFKQNGGKMKFLYGLYNPTDDKSKKLWKAFLDAFERAGMADRIVLEQGTEKVE